MLPVSGPVLSGVLCELWRDVVPQGNGTVLTPRENCPCGHHHPIKPSTPEPSGRALHWEVEQPDTWTNRSPPAPSSQVGDWRTKLSVICSFQNITLLFFQLKSFESKRKRTKTPCIFTLRAGVWAEEMPVYLSETNAGEMLFEKLIWIHKVMLNYYFDLTFIRLRILSFYPDCGLWKKTNTFESHFTKSSSCI